MSDLNDETMDAIREQYPTLNRMLRPDMEGKAVYAEIWEIFVALRAARKTIVKSANTSTLETATTLDLLEAACARLAHQQACEVAALAFRLPEDALRGVGG